MACRKYSPWHQKDGNKSSSGCDNDCMVGWSELKLGRLARQLSGESILCIILAAVDWLRRTFSNLIKHLTLVSLGVQQTFDIRLQYSDFGWWHEHMLPWMLRAWLSKKKKKKQCRKIAFPDVHCVWKCHSSAPQGVRERGGNNLPRPPLSWKRGAVARRPELDRCSPTWGPGHSILQLKGGLLNHHDALLLSCFGKTM